MKKITFLVIAFFIFTGIAVAGTKITLGTCEWAPYLSENLKNGGITTDITKAAFKKAGYDAEVKFMDWNRAVGLAQSGKIAGIVGCYSTKERAKNFGISKSIGDVSVVFFQKKVSNITYSSLEDLKPYKIGVMRGNAHTDEFDSASYLKKEPVDKLELNIKKLLKGRVDLIVGSQLVTQDEINKKFPREAHKIEVIKPPLKNNTLHVGVSKKYAGNDKILQDLDKGLKMIEADGTLAKIMKSHGY